MAQESWKAWRYYGQALARYPGGKLTRPWQEIAEEASQETNPQKLLTLIEELSRALEEKEEMKRFKSMTEH